jgi:hypothetical protein
MDFPFDFGHWILWKWSHQIKKGISHKQAKAADPFYDFSSKQPKLNANKTPKPLHATNPGATQCGNGNPVGACGEHQVYDKYLAQGGDPKQIKHSFAVQRMGQKINAVPRCDTCKTFDSLQPAASDFRNRRGDRTVPLVKNYEEVYDDEYYDE